MDLDNIFRGLKNILANPLPGMPSGQPHQFPVDPKSPLHARHALINQFLAELPDPANNKVKAGAYPSGLRIVEASDSEQILIIEAMMRHRTWIEKKGFENPNCGWTLRNIAHQLWRRDLPYSPSQLIALIQIVISQVEENGQFDGEFVPILRIGEKLKEQGMLSAELQNALLNLKAALKARMAWDAAGRKRACDTIDRLVHADLSPLNPGEAWSNAAARDLEQMSSELRNAWLKLIYHCLDTGGSKPTQKWNAAAQTMLEAIGRDSFKAQVMGWFELVASPRPIHVEPRAQYEPDPDWLITDRNASLLKGLAWSCAGWKDVELVRAVSRLAQTCFKKVRNLGARCPRVGNACLYVLSATSTNEAAAELSRLNQAVKQPSAKKLIGKSLDGVAEATGQTRDDLEESTVPTYELDTDGRRKETFGDFTAEFCAFGPDAFELSWRKADGKKQKSVPAEVKEKHASELKALKRTIGDIEKMLPAQRHRIERLLLTGHEWDFESWRKRYLEHPLLAHLARRLIWHFKLGERIALGIWLNGKMLDVHDQPVDWLAPETRVRLWHPIGFPVETVAAWREWLLAHEICQPFKQAHREIYILTDAEQTTGTYSNRFAAHILRQHQFAALAKDRGWSYLLQGAFDSHNVPTLRLPQWDLSVEFWVDYPGGQATTSGSGIFLHVATDQVRFIRQGEALPLIDIPATVFTEVMRDVDLFVGVASIGNDPAWQDHGEIQGGGVYWHNFSFGDLNATAKTRKEVMEKLLPKLKIAAQCSLDDKFLVVKGGLRTYKIHLGSANIQMEPNNQYLCIVPGRGESVKGDDKLFLPFEGDRTLAIILSKAFLLADDSKIKDPSIVNQIKR